MGSNSTQHHADLWKCGLPIPAEKVKTAKEIVNAFLHGSSYGMGGERFVSEIGESIILRGLLVEFLEK